MDATGSSTSDPQTFVTFAGLVIESNTLEIVKSKMHKLNSVEITAQVWNAPNRIGLSRPNHLASPFTVTASFKLLAA